MTAIHSTPPLPQLPNQTSSPEPCIFGDAQVSRLVPVVLSRFNSLPPAIVGLPGNLMIILIARRKRNRNLSPSVFMTAMAVADSVLLMLAAVFFFLYYGPGYIVNHRDTSYVMCLTTIITCGMLSGFYLSAMSVDRLIAVHFPMVAPSLCTPGKARKVVIIGSILIIAANMNLLRTLQYYKDTDTGIEVLALGVPEDAIASLLANIFQLLFGTVLPFAIIITCNVLIIATVKSAAKQRNKLQGQVEKQQKKDETQYLTRMLIFASFAYVVTSIPYRLYMLVLLIPEVAAKFDLTLTCDFILYNFIIATFYAIWVWNFATNYFMYCIGGGKRYRADSLEVLRELVLCGKKY